MTDTVGLDIGHTAIKAVRVRRALGGRESVTCFQQKFPVIANASVSLEQKAQILKQFVQAHGLIGLQVVTALPCSQLFVRTLTLPFLDAKKLAQVVPCEVESMIPLPLEEVAVDYQRLSQQAPSPTVKSGPSSHILVAAVPKSTLTSHVRSLADAGLDSGAIQVDALAVLALAQHLGKGTAAVPENLVIIDLGASKTTICLSHQGDPWLVRTIQCGTDRLARAMSHPSVCALVDPADPGATDASPSPCLAPSAVPLAPGSAGFPRFESAKTDCDPLSSPIIATVFTDAQGRASSPWPEPARSGSLPTSPSRPEPAKTGSLPIAPARPEPAKTGSFPIAPARPESVKTDFLSISAARPESVETDSLPRSPAFSALVRELRRTLHAYEATTHTRLQSVWFCGGGARSTLLTTELGRSLELELIGLPQTRWAPEYSVALGLAVRDHADGIRAPFRTASLGAGINLKRVMDKTLAEFQDRWRQLRYVGLASLAIIGLLFSDLSVQMVLKQARLQELKTALRNEFLTQFTGMDVVTNELEQAKATLSAMRKTTDRLGRDEPEMVSRLTALTRRLPKGVLIKMHALTMEQDTIQMEAETDSFESVEKVKAGLAQFPGATDVAVRDARIGASPNQVLFRLMLAKGSP